MAEHGQLLLWALLLIIPVVYLGAPLGIRFQQRLPAHPQLKALDFDTLRPHIAQFLATQTTALFDLGFDEPTLVKIPRAAPHVTAYLIMLVNRQAGDKAMVTVIVGEPAPIQTLFVEFSTRFESGEIFNTLNSGEIPAFPPGPTTVRTHVPNVTDPRQLYELHSYVMNKHGPAGKKLLYEAGQALDYLAHDVLVECYEKQVQRRWLYYDQAGDCYRPTLKGAYLMTWGLMQPFKALRKAAVLKRATKMVKEFQEAAAL
jgi:hypothetical protein